MLLQSRSLLFNILLLAILVGVPYAFLWAYLYLNGAIGMGVLGVVSVLLLFDAFLLYIFIRGLMLPLKEVSRVLRRVSDGDFSVTVNNPYHGNIGQMLTDVETSVNSIHAMMANILENTVNIASGSFNTVAASARVVFNIEEENQHVSGIDSAGQQLSGSIAGIADHARLANESSHSANQAVTNGSTIIEDTIHCMEQLGETVSEGAAKMESLGESSRKIGEISNVINGIAEQTNLLALNAAIEAARAGEHGRGFAVVADEVRGLAERTSQATSEIAGMITNIQNDTDAMIDTMHVGVERANSGKDTAQRSGEAFNNIREEISTVSRIIGDIADTAQAQNEATQEISNRIQVIAEFSQGNHQHSSHAIDIIGDMNAVIGNQLRTLEGFTIPHMALLIAKSDHVMWKKRLTEMLMGHAQMRDGEVSDHHSCRFGKWYYSEGMSHYRDNPTFTAIEEPHAEIHKTAADIISAFNSGNVKDAQRLLESLDEPTEKVLGLLTTLYQQEAGVG